MPCSPSGRTTNLRSVRTARAVHDLDGAAVLVGLYVDPAAGKRTVEEWSKTWMSQRVHLKPKTLAGYDSLLRSRVIPRWGRVQLGRVERADVVAWVASMPAEGLSASRTRQAYHLFRGMLEDAVKDGKLPRNAAASVALPRIPARSRRYLTHEQVAVLADECGAHRALVLVLAYCGLRWGEAAALRVRSVDLTRARIDVVEAVTEIGGQLSWGTPKSHQSRSVPIPRFLCDELAVLIARRQPADLVFASPEDAVLRLSNGRKRCFDRAAAKVGLTGLTPHELRHTAASLAIATGANVKTVQRMLGHASAAMTLDRYGRLMDADLDVVAQKMSEVRERVVPQVCPTPVIALITERETAV